jgi:WD40 repeat protein
MRRRALLLTFALLAAGRGLLAQELKECASLQGEPRQVALRPDGKMGATLIGAPISGKRQAEVKLWDIASSKEVAAFDFPAHDLQASTFSPDGRFLAAAGGDSMVVWDVKARKQLHAKERIGSVYTLVFSPDAKKLGAAGLGGVRLWDLASGKELFSFPAKGRAFSPDLRTLAAPDYEEIDLWDMTTGKRRTTLSEHQGEVRYVEFSADGKTLVAASGFFNDRKRHHRGEIRLWDVATGRERAVFQKGIEYVWPAHLSPDGKTLALLDRGVENSFRLKLLNVATGKQRLVRPPSGHSLTSIAFARDGRLFLFGTPDGKTIKIWEVPENGRR